jgi:hypothetical protein
VKRSDRFSAYLCELLVRSVGLILGIFEAIRYYRIQGRIHSLNLSDVSINGLTRRDVARTNSARNLNPRRVKQICHGGGKNGTHSV